MCGISICNCANLFARLLQAIEYSRFRPTQIRARASVNTVTGWLVFNRYGLKWVKAEIRAYVSLKWILFKESVCENNFEWHATTRRVWSLYTQRIAEQAILLASVVTNNFSFCKGTVKRMSSAINALILFHAKSAPSSQEKICECKIWLSGNFSSAKEGMNFDSSLESKVYSVGYSENPVFPILRWIAPLTYQGQARPWRGWTTRRVWLTRQERMYISLVTI